MARSVLPAPGDVSGQAALHDWGNGAIKGEVPKMNVPLGLLAMWNRGAIRLHRALGQSGSALLPDRWYLPMYLDAGRADPSGGDFWQSLPRTPEGIPTRPTRALSRSVGGSANGVRSASPRRSNSPASAEMPYDRSRFGKGREAAHPVVLLALFAFVGIGPSRLSEPRPTRRVHRAGSRRHYIGRTDQQSAVHDRQTRRRDRRLRRRWMHRHAWRNR
jgi:hypothetical protein